MRREVAIDLFHQLGCGEHDINEFLTGFVHDADDVVVVKFFIKHSGGVVCDEGDAGVGDSSFAHCDCFGCGGHADEITS